MGKVGFWILTVAVAVGVVVIMSLNADPETTLADDDLASTFRAVQTSIGNGGNFDGACKSELGNNWQLADFSDIVEFHDDGGSIPDLVDSLRWNLDYGEPEFTSGQYYLAVSRSGELTYGSRQYFVQRHDHNPPGNFLVHAHVNGHHISLGSWHSDGWTALCYQDAPPPPTPTPTPTPTPEPEPLPPQKQALIDFYNATNGKRWRENDSWLTDKPLSHWYGIKTDGQGNVVEIKLPNNNLSGTIPRLAFPGDLTVLDLSNNKLTGAIPTLPFTLTKINLSNNSLTGRLPGFSGLSYLRDLDISYNRLSGGFPTGLPLSLEKLNLSSNFFAGQLPDDRVFLPPRISELRVSDNNFTGCIPIALQGIGTNDFNDLKIPFCEVDRAPLEALYHATNGPGWKSARGWLSNLPLAEWHGITTNDDGRVTHIYLSGNQLKSNQYELGDLAIPRQIGDLTELMQLDLSTNDLKGELPSELRQLKNLKELLVAENDLYGCVEEDLRETVGRRRGRNDIVFASLAFCDKKLEEPTFPSYIHWHISKSVEPSEARAAKLGVHWLLEWAKNRWKVTGRDVHIYMDTEFPSFPECNLRFSPLSGDCKSNLARGENIFIKASGPMSIHEHASKRLYTIADAAIHEAIHILFQWQPSHSPLVAPKPMWLTEGMAKYFSAVVADGKLTRSITDASRGKSFIEEQRHRWVHDAKNLDLSCLTSKEDFFYQCGALAIEILASLVADAHGGGWIDRAYSVRKFVQFYYELPSPVIWRDTFGKIFGESIEKTFGETLGSYVDRFYDLYACHQDNGFDLKKLKTCK